LVWPEASLARSRRWGLSLEQDEEVIFLEDLNADEDEEHEQLLLITLEKRVAEKNIRNAM
jgi:hypothetical protein